MINILLKDWFLPLTFLQIKYLHKQLGICKTLTSDFFEEKAYVLGEMAQRP